MRAALLICLLLTGCASADYAKYAEMQLAIQSARSNAEIERYKAMSRIAETGDTVTRVSAMMAILLNQHPQEQQIQPPKSGWDSVREWAAIIVPAAASAYGYHTSMLSAVTSSNNSRETSISTNRAFVSMAGQIQAPAANVSTVTPTYTTTTTTESHNPTSNSNNPTSTSSDSHANQNNPITTTYPTTVTK